MTLITAVQGTWGRRLPWWGDGSPFWRYLAEFDLMPARVRLDPTAAGRPFEWETGLGSSLLFWRRLGWGRRGVEAWEFAGKALAYYLQTLPYEDRNVIAHSHGGQVALWCAAQGLPMARLITVGTPVRSDMDGVIALARASIGEWRHVCDRERDWVAVFGRFGDGRLGGGRTFAAADRNVMLEDVGHSELFTNETVFHKWVDAGLVDFLRGHDDGRTDPPAGHGAARPADPCAA